MAEVKLSVKFGVLEIEYSGPISFVEERLADFCERISALDVPSKSIPEPKASGAIIDTNPAGSAPADLEGISMNALAQKYGVSKGVDLLKVAAIHLSIVQGKEVFPKSAILEEAKKATSYYKESTHRKNIGSLTNTMLKEDFLREQGGDNVAVSANAMTSARSMLGVS